MKYPTSSSQRHQSLLRFVTGFLTDYCCLKNVWKMYKKLLKQPLRRHEESICPKRASNPEEFISWSVSGGIRWSRCFKRLNVKKKLLWKILVWKWNKKTADVSTESRISQQLKQSYSPYSASVHRQEGENGQDFIKRGRVERDWIGRWDHHGNEDLHGVEHEGNVGGSFMLKWSEVGGNRYSLLQFFFFFGRFSWPRSKHSH